MEEEEGHTTHPKTEVNFAGTEAFAKEYGQEAARKAQLAFQRPSWHKVRDELNPLLTKEESEQLFSKRELLILGAALVTGAALTWIVVRNSSGATSM